MFLSRGAYDWDAFHSGLGDFRQVVSEEPSQDWVGRGPSVEEFGFGAGMELTPGKMNTEPENHWFVEENSLSGFHSQVPCQFPGVSFSIFWPGKKGNFH